MAIAFTKYVNITSGVGAGSSVRQRDLIGRLFTANSLVPPQSMLEFTTLEEVGSYFGTDSDEYARATFYFGWISKNITAPQKIAFARWAETAVAPMVFGLPATYSVSNFTSVSTGSLTITMGGTTAHQLTGIDLSAVTSLADVASALQTAIRAYSAGGAIFTAATVTYDATRKSFNLVGGATGVAPMHITAGVTGTDIASRLGWLAGSIQAVGSAAETVTQTLQASADASNNFGSFLFMPVLTIDEVTAAANWNKAQNNMFLYTVGVATADEQAWHDALIGIGGITLTLLGVADEYPEQVPMMILAATDYTARDSVQNYMFQQFNLTPSVSTTALSDALDLLRINYYGRTQTAGQFIDFYQRGVMMGLSVDPSDQNTYANEIWLKDYIGSQVMNLFLSLGQVPANKQGANQIQAIIDSSIDLALTNGVISVGKPLTQQQKLYIGQLTGDPQAWNQVQNTGYWLGVSLEEVATEEETTEWQAKYTLIYSKDDAVRRVIGQHVLI